MTTQEHSSTTKREVLLVSLGMVWVVALDGAEIEAEISKCLASVEM